LRCLTEEGGRSKWRKKVYKARGDSVTLALVMDGGDSFPIIFGFSLLLFLWGKAKAPHKYHELIK